MDYEKKYKEALELARDYYKANLKLYKADENVILEDIFPELKESEDDRIRKELIKEINGLWENDSATWPSSLEKKNKYIAWLEKQGEQKPNYTTLVETGNGGINALVTRELPTDGEQKPAWTKEDEDRLTSCIEAITACYQWDSMIEWLKSLKDRYTWKPNKEQMKALHDLNLTGNISYAGQGQVLIELYNDLKKLKE